MAATILSPLPLVWRRRGWALRRRHANARRRRRLNGNAPLNANAARRRLNGNARRNNGNARLPRRRGRLSAANWNVFDDKKKNRNYSGARARTGQHNHSAVTKNERRRLDDNAK